MTYIEFVINCLKKGTPCKPIYTAEIAKEFAREYDIDMKKARAAVAVAIKRIMNGKLFENLRFYQKGIYYITVKTPFGETGIDKEVLIRDKYLLPDIGYESGHSVLHKLGLTTQIPIKRVIVTNKAKDCIREDKNLNVFIRPPKEKLTAQNKRYFQLLDTINLMDKAPIDAEDPYGILAEYLEKFNIQYRQLLAFANKYYGTKDIIKIADIASIGGVSV